MQSFQHVRVDLSEHSSGWYLRSAECLSSFDTLRRNMEKFALASEGSELLLRFLHDTESQEAVFLLARDFFRAVHASPSSLLLPTFRLSLLSLLGFLPSFKEHHASELPSHLQNDLSPSLRSYLCSTASFLERVRQSLSMTDTAVLQQLSEALLQDHLSSPLKSGMISLSSEVTPISSMLGRAS